MFPLTQMWSEAFTPSIKENTGPLFYSIFRISTEFLLVVKNLRRQKNEQNFLFKLLSLRKWTVHRRSTVRETFLSRCLGSEISISKRNVCPLPAPMKVSIRKECWCIGGNLQTPDCILWLSYYLRAGIVCFRGSAVSHNVQTLNPSSM